MTSKALHTLLRLSLAFIWLWTGLVVLFLAPMADSLALIAPLGLPEWLATYLIQATAIFELFMGIAMIANWRVRIWAAVQIFLIVAFTLIITIFLPAQWLHPFGPISKNIPLLAATIVLYTWEKRREQREDNVYSFHSDLDA